MATKKKDPESTLPQTVADTDTTQSSNITYASDVVAIIAGLAAVEVEGIAGMCSVGGSLLNKNRNVTKGIKVEIGTEEVSIDLYVVVESDTPIQRAAHDAQESVRKAIESMTGLHVVRVDVHVQGVSFEKENIALETGAENAVLEAGNPEDAGMSSPTENLQAAPDESAEAPAETAEPDTEADTEKTED